MALDQTSINKLETLINGKRIEYDACSQSDLEVAKSIYNKGWEYIGSGNEIFVNGNPNLSKDWYHFFVRTSDDDIDDYDWAGTADDL